MVKFEYRHSLVGEQTFSYTIRLMAQRKKTIFVVVVVFLNLWMLDDLVETSKWKSNKLGTLEIQKIQD